TRSRLPAVRTLPSRTWVTDSRRATSASSLPSWRARNAEVRDATRTPGTRTSAFMISSAIPSQRYSWSFSGPMSAKGSTAIALAFARIGQQFAEKSDGVPVQGIQCDGPFRGISETREFPLEEERLGKAEVGQMARGRHLHGSSGGRQSAGQGIRLKSEALPIV